VLLAGTVLLGTVLPSLGWAASGGSGGAGLSANAPKAPPTVVQPGDVTVTAQGNGITIASRESALLRNSLAFTGTVPRSDAGHTIEIERNGHETGWSWASTVTTKVSRRGSFSATWTTNHIGQFAIRAVIQGGASAAAASPSMMVTVYRPSIATEYGQGFWGSKTACGETLKRSMLGTANRTLPCGTKVAIYYHGRTLTVPVIDRGPYANHADWDLTEATDKALGIPGTATIGAVSLPKRPQN
jgi:hypothetical protein